MEPLAQKKAQNFLEFQSLYPEFDFVFVGDNGQARGRARQLHCPFSPWEVFGPQIRQRVRRTTPRVGRTVARPQRGERWPFGSWLREMTSAPPES